jgi:hypothetical protein
MAIGLCSSIWLSHLSPNPQRMSTSMALSRFLSHLHLYYNQHLYTTKTPRLRYMRSISSSRGTCIHLPPSHHVITCAMIGYISSCSLTCGPSISPTTPYCHTHSLVSVSRSSLLLASLWSITLSSHSLPLSLALKHKVVESEMRA